MSSNSSGKKLEGFFTGKGFYIVLFLCAAVIGVSAWMMATGNEAMEDLSKAKDVSLENKRVETVILPPVAEPAELPAQAETAPVMAEDEAPAQGESSEVWRQGDVMEVAAPLYIWPVQGTVERYHQLDELSYDVTLEDWRTHSGIDISSALGTEIAASHSGTVESIVNDELYGAVITLDHGDGSRSVYANLAADVAVSVGDWVEPGDLLGSVGDTALCEIGQAPHLHFAIMIDGESVNPLSYLPA